MIERRRHCMHCYTRLIIPCMLMGMIATVAVAWTCVYSQVGEDRPPQYFRFERDGRRSLLIVMSRLGTEYVVKPGSQGAASVYVPTRYKFYERKPWWPVDAGVSTAWVGHVGGGWPRLALSAAIRPSQQHGSDDRQESGMYDIEYGLRWRADMPNGPAAGHIPTILPYRIIWPGFLLDTVVYASVIGVSISAYKAMRHVWRAGRGRCVHCGYPRGVSATCSECGEPL